ncbi:MAG: sigma-70 family RNA polymerase sigma factor [Sporocytophaga sp.]|uniref:RNA polymerase sigma factor n=1 Tax=Sporocytophaga sp. TaxID=2231183 RepID=UPI001B0F6ABB|nr:sigma-70 family RNA polymerase sigma factor [Sporocytophaga sp.]MBO9701397.1 sigma-70 family RNA polymerase sigma factor [Sporocytophaga sp.]
MKISEHEIPLLIKQGNDKEVITELYKIVFPKVKKYIVRHNGIKDDAYDVFQDALLYFYKQVVEDRFSDKYTVFGYVYRLSINRWLNKLKKDQRVNFTSELESSNGIEFDEEENKYLSILKEGENLLEKLFSNIGEKCVELLTYTIYYDLMAEDIALRMGFTSEGAVKMQIKRCREKLYAEAEKDPSILEKIRG